MTALTLTRISQSAFATYGQLSDAEQRQYAVTLELPWENNQHDVSCIPAGSYHAVRRLSHLHGGTGVHDYDVFELMDVPSRGAIELHIGNLPHDSKGCILLGSNFGTVNGQHGITGSQAAFARFMDEMRGVDAFTLTVTDPTPPLVDVSS
jgi:hypothetical protein